MTWEIGLICAILIALVMLTIAFIIREREHKRRQEQWENDVYDLHDKLLKRLDHISSQVVQTIDEENNRLDENMQKRHHYLKKSFNDIADRLDMIEQLDKRTKDLHIQTDRTNQLIHELIAYMPKSSLASKEEMEENHTPLPMDEDVAKVIHYYQQGVSVEQIAQQMGRAIPEIQLILHIFAGK